MDSPASVGVKWILVLLGFLFVAGVVIVVLTELDSGRGDALGGTLSTIVAFATFFGVGAAIANRRPRHPIGWLFVGMGTYPIAQAAISGVGRRVAEGGGSETLLLLGDIAFSWPALVGTLVVFVPLLFPTGRLPSRNWRWLAWLAGGTLASVTGAQMVQRQFCVSYGTSGECLARRDNPIGVSWMESLEESAVGDVLLVLLLICMVGAWISLFIRYRRSHGVERAQLRWFTLAIGLFMGYMLLIAALPPEVFSIAELMESLPLGLDPFGVFLSLVPLSVGVAILRYRLYDIDRFISRTISYGIITTVLIVTYAVAVFALRKLLPGQSDLAVAGSTLAVATLFNPVRHRIQGVVDRRFNRAHYDAEAVMDDFATTLKDRIDLDGLVAAWVGVVAKTMEPTTVSAWVDSDD